MPTALLRSGIVVVGRISRGMEADNMRVLEHYKKAWNMHNCSKLVESAIVMMEVRVHDGDDDGRN